MFKLFRRWWKYLTAKLTGSFEERADPKVQLQQAITAAQEQHKQLTEQAANVIANQKQTELKLNRRLEDLEKLNRQARQAVTMADEATKSGNADKAVEYTRAAESIANQLIAVENEVEDLKELSLQAAQASDQAKNAVQQNATALQQKLTEQQQLMGQLEQAKMQEQMNSAMQTLSTTVGDDVPSLDQVRLKIESQYAKAKGLSELQGASVESRMLEIEQAAQNAEASARLDQIRSQLGLSAGDGAGETTAVEEGSGRAAPQGDTSS